MFAHQGEIFHRRAPAAITGRSLDPVRCCLATDFAEPYFLSLVTVPASSLVNLKLLVSSAATAFASSLAGSGGFTLGCGGVVTGPADDTVVFLFSHPAIGTSTSSVHKTGRRQIRIIIVLGQVRMHIALVHVVRVEELTGSAMPRS